MNRIVTHRVRKTMGRYEKQRRDHEHGHTISTVKVGDEEVEFTLTVDLDALIDRLGAKAWRNVSKRSTIAWAHVQVKAKKV